MIQSPWSRKCNSIYFDRRIITGLWKINTVWLLLINQFQVVNSVDLHKDDLCTKQ